jgi:hypothetical protein
MGNQLSFHGLLRLQRRPRLLAPMGFQNGFRGIHAPLRWNPWPCSRNGLYDWPVLLALCRALSEFSAIHDDIFPVRFRGHYTGSYCWLLPMPHELLRLDDVCAALAHLLLHNRRILSLGWWLPVQNGSH